MYYEIIISTDTFICNCLSSCPCYEHRKEMNDILSRLQLNMIRTSGLRSGTVRSMARFFRKSNVILMTPLTVSKLLRHTSMSSWNNRNNIPSKSSTHQVLSCKTLWSRTGIIWMLCVTSAYAIIIKTLVTLYDKVVAYMCPKNVYSNRRKRNLTRLDTFHQKMTSTLSVSLCICRMTSTLSVSLCICRMTSTLSVSLCICRWHLPCLWACVSVGWHLPCLWACVSVDDIYPVCEPVYL